MRMWPRDHCEDAVVSCGMFEEVQAVCASEAQQLSRKLRVHGGVWDILLRASVRLWPSVRATMPQPSVALYTDQSVPSKLAAVPRNTDSCSSASSLNPETFQPLVRASAHYFTAFCLLNVFVKRLG